MLGWGKERMCRGYVKRLRRHQGMVTLGLGAGAVRLTDSKYEKQNKELAKEVTLNVLYKALLTIKKVC